MGKYRLYCPSCKTSFADVFTNICPRCGPTGSLIKTDYQDKKFKPLNVSGFWKFLPWLPCSDLKDEFDSGTVVYMSTGLARELGLKKLYIAFNGYWPEKNAKMITCTFKELEAPPTFQRAVEKCIDNLVIASAGNTAKAFIHSAQYFNIKLFVVVPYNCKGRLALPFEKPENVTIIAVNKGSDYSDSISFASRISNELNIVNEGGARNVARRDGMGTVMLEAVRYMGKLPDHYFQAVGSGTGAIAAFEASERILATSQRANRLPKLHLSQNVPFTPIVDSWHDGSNKLKPLAESEQREAIAKVFAKVLTNRHPPYSVGGGVFDILSLSEGEMYGITNKEAHSAAKLFESTEGIDLVPAASVCVASLVQALEKNTINDNETVLLNITGGGEKRLWEDFEVIKAEPDLICDDAVDMQELKSNLEALHAK